MNCGTRSCHKSKALGAGVEGGEAVGEWMRGRRREGGTRRARGTDVYQGHLQTQLSLPIPPLVHVPPPNAASHLWPRPALSPLHTTAFVTQTGGGRHHQRRCTPARLTLGGGAPSPWAVGAVLLMETVGTTQQRPSGCRTSMGVLGRAPSNNSGTTGEGGPTHPAPRTPPPS